MEMPSTAVGRTENDRPMSGNATFTMVVSSALMKMEATNTTATAAFSLGLIRTGPSPDHEDAYNEDTHYLMGVAEMVGTGSDTVDAIIHAAHRIRTTADAALRTHGLSLPGLKLLTALGDGDRSMREISEILHVAPRTVTDITDGMQARGLVTRHSHPADRRVTLLRLTEAGARELTTAAAEGERVALASISALAPGEQRTLRDLLERVCRP